MRRTWVSKTALLIWSTHCTLYGWKKSVSWTESFLLKIPAINSLYYLHEQFMVCQSLAELFLSWSPACYAMPSIFTASHIINNCISVKTNFLTHSDMLELAFSGFVHFWAFAIPWLSMLPFPWWLFKAFHDLNLTIFLEISKTFSSFLLHYVLTGKKICLN